MGVIIRLMGRFLYLLPFSTFIENYYIVFLTPSSAKGVILTHLTPFRVLVPYFFMRPINLPKRLYIGRS